MLASARQDWPHEDTHEWYCIPPRHTIPKAAATTNKAQHKISLKCYFLSLIKTKIEITSINVDDYGFQPYKILTALRDLRPEINVNSMFGAEVSVVSQCSAQTAAPTATGLVAALLLVDVWTNVAMTRSKHTLQKHVTLGSIICWATCKKIIMD